MSPEVYSVGIVGFGPVAAMTALQLANAGLRVLILERSRDPVVLPRAVGLDGESVRAAQRIGYGNEVAAICQPPRERDEVVFTNSKRETLFGSLMPKLGTNGWRDNAFFDQPELEELLRGFVAADDRIDVELGREVVALEQDEKQVRLRSRKRGEAAEQEHRASFVIGCDGASSFVRGASGIEWQSLGYDQDWLVVDVLQGPGAKLPLVTMQVCDPARLATYVCVKDPNRRWEFQLLEGESREEMLQPEKIQELIDPWTGREHYEIRRAAVYQFHAATADRWQVGRVFLAGDAAHQTPPFLGQGLNAGLRDALNLGWKIPLVLDEVCDAGLLESYAEERDAHARDLVQWAVAIGQLMETLAAREAGLPDPYVADQSSGYGQGRTAPPLRGGVLVTEQCEGEHPVGVLVSQPTVRTQSGRKLRLDELLGKGFAVLARKDDDIQLSPEARVVLDKLGGNTVSMQQLEVVEGNIDRLFDDHPAAVIRPDRYVFGVVDAEWDLDRLLVELGRKLGLR